MEDVSEDVFRFQDGVQAVLNKATKFLLDKYLLKHSLVKNLACFHPREIVRDPEDSKSISRRVVRKLDNAKTVRAKDCDDLLQQYNQIVDKVASASNSKYSSCDP